MNVQPSQQSQAPGSAENECTLLSQQAYSLQQKRPPRTSVLNHRPDAGPTRGRGEGGVPIGPRVALAGPADRVTYLPAPGQKKGFKSWRHKTKSVNKWCPSPLCL